MPSDDKVGFGGEPVLSVTKSSSRGCDTISIGRSHN